jgi:hypothetical protein
MSSRTAVHFPALGRVIFLVGLLVSSVSVADEQESLSSREIAGLLDESLISIATFVGGQPYATGSGFAVNSSGLIATNYHVIEGGETIELKTSSGETFTRVEVVNADARRDLALLQITTTGLDALPFSEVDSIGVGDDVYAMGNPLGLEATFSSGIVSALRVMDGVQILQITAPISSGSSGGPVVNGQGQVVGVSTAVMESGQNLNFAVPSKYVQGLINTADDGQAFEAFARQNWGGSSDAMASTDAPAAAAPGSSAAPSGVEISPWVLSTAQEMNYDLGHLMGDFDTMDFADQEVFFQLVLQVEELDKEGYDLTDFTVTGVADQDGILEMSQTLQPGFYLALGLCDSDCSDIDLVVVDSNGQVLGSDEEDDSYPVVTFDLKNSEQIDIATKIYECSIEPCRQFIGVARRR